MSVSLPKTWRDDIDKRAEGLGMTRSSYLRLLVKKWREDGFPAVNEPDRLMQVAKSTRGNRAPGAR
jgi:hypothetical protein